MTPREVVSLAEDRLRADGVAVEGLEFSHAVYLPAGSGSVAFDQRESWFVYFGLPNPPDDGLTDHNTVTVAVDDRTGESRRVT